MRKLLTLIIIVMSIMTFTSCENYSNGTRVGTVNNFSRSGKFGSTKSWEGHLNITQIDMTSCTNGFDFSVDNDNESQYLVKTIDSAMNNGWKVELQYHQTKFKNLLYNRGNTNYFVTGCKVIDRNLSNIGKEMFMQTDNMKVSFVVNLTLSEAIKMGIVDSIKSNLLNK